MLKWTIWLKEKTMKKLMILFVMVALIEIVFVGMAKAADPNMPHRPRFDPNTIRGRVVVDKDANGVIISIKVENKRWGDWQVVLDEKGRQLAELDGKTVAVKGKEEIKGNVKWLVVESFQQLKRPEGRPGHGQDPNRPRRPMRPRGEPRPEQGQK